MVRASSSSPTLRRVGVLAIALVFVGLATHWYVSRQRAKRGAASLYNADVALAACALDRAPPQQARQISATLGARVELAFATSRPLQACDEAARAFADSAARQRAAPYHRSPESVDTLASLAGDLARFPWSAPASDLAARVRDAHLATLLDRALGVGCDVAIAENVFASPPCPRAGPVRVVAVPPPHGALGVALGSLVGEVAWSATARGDTLALAVSGTSRDRAVTGTWLSVRRGTGRWTQTDLETAPSTGDAPFVAPGVAFAGDRPVFALDGQTIAGGGWHGVASRLDLATSSATRVAAVDALPAGLVPVRAGARLLVQGDRPLLALAGADADPDRRGALLRFPSGTTTTVTPAPDGRLIAAWQIDRPYVALATHTASGVEIRALAVPAPPTPWADPVIAAVPGTELPTIDAGSAVTCGDRFVAAARAGARTFLVDASAGAVHVVPVATRAGASLAIACGACAPLLLEKRDDGLRLWTADGRTAVDVPLPVAADVASRRGASIACTLHGLFVAYVAHGALLVQRSTDAGKSFAAPQIVATPTHDGAPSEARVLAVGERALALWRRTRRGARDIAFEYVETSDGVIWH